MIRGTPENHLMELFPELAGSDSTIVLYRGMCLPNEEVSQSILVGGMRASILSDPEKGEELTRLPFQRLVEMNDDPDKYGLGRDFLLYFASSMPEATGYTRGHAFGRANNGCNYGALFVTEVPKVRVTEDLQDMSTNPIFFKPRYSPWYLATGLVLPGRFLRGFINMDKYEFHRNPSFELSTSF